MYTPTPAYTPHRRRWPIFAGVLGLLVVLGLLAAMLLSGRGYDPSNAGDEAAVQLAVADAGGLGELDLTDGANDPNAAPSADTSGEPPRRHPPLLRRLGDDTLLVGTVASAADGTLTVTRDVGGELTVTTTENTRVRGGGNASLGDLTAGERVVVRVGTDKQAIGVLVLRPHVAGTVTALDGDRATVTRASGLTQVVDVSALADKPQVGDLIAVVGSSADGGATLKAEKIKQLPETS